MSKKHSGTRPNPDQLLPNQGHTSHLHLLAIMVTSSEVLLIVKKVLPKEAGWSSLLMAELLGRVKAKIDLQSTICMRMLNVFQLY